MAMVTPRTEKTSPRMKRFSKGVIFFLCAFPILIIALFLQDYICIGAWTISDAKEQAFESIANCSLTTSDHVSEYRVGFIDFENEIHFTSTPSRIKSILSKFGFQDITTDGSYVGESTPSWWIPKSNTRKWRVYTWSDQYSDVSNLWVSPDYTEAYGVYFWSWGGI